MAITQRPVETFDLLRKVGSVGASVTMPHKLAALSYSNADGTSKAVGAANTIRFEGPRTFCTNTDVAGVTGPLGPALASAGLGRGSKVLVLGAGGAALAVVHGCKSLGLDIAITSIESAEAARFPGVRFIPWEERASSRFDVIINTTPLAGSQDPWPAGAGTGARVVFDIAISGEPSTFLGRAKADGAAIIGPREMWVHQGAAQIGWITGISVDPDELRGFMP
jgi:shikimate 5-dehydrogenase